MNTNSLKKNVLKVIFLVYSLTLIVMSVVPLDMPAPKEVPVDKIVHSLAYLVLAILTANALSPSGTKSNIIRAFIFTVLFGFTLECIQYFLPLRSFDIFDIACNIAGALVGSICVYGFKKI
ncbi:MAG: VanZ family protein [Candidatus Omnitrophica bacterium]|nr:VanZ family protein [Candidatus Omnitrophota bacterium]